MNNVISEIPDNNEFGTFAETENADGTIHYRGFLGDFNYDPTEYMPCQIEMLNDEGEKSMMHCLRYIGTETDAAKIKIPTGITDTSMMFMGSEINGVPTIPNSVATTYAMFANCKNIENANFGIGPNLREMPFMFSGCTNLKYGPAVIPGTVKDINFAFSGCENLEATPQIKNGVECGECAFMGCKKLRVPPKIPNSMKDYKYMTAGCDTLDEVQDEKARQAFNKNRARLEKKLSAPTMRERIWHGFSAVMQVHAFRQQGYGFIMAPVVVAMGRKNGMLAKSATGALATNLMGKGGLSSYVGYMLNEREKTSESRALEKKMQDIDKLRRFDDAFDKGIGSKKDLKSQTKALKDMKKGTFLKAADLGSTDKQLYQTVCDSTYGMRESVLAKVADEGNLTPKVKSTCSKWYRTQMSAAVTYYTEGKRAIEENPDYTSAQKEEALRGLTNLSKLQTQPLMEYAERAQHRFGIFHDGDMKDIMNMTKYMPSEQEKSTTFADRVGWNMQGAADMARDRAESYVQSRLHPAGKQVNDNQRDASQGTRELPHLDSVNNDYDDDCTFS